MSAMVLTAQALVSLAVITFTIGWALGNIAGPWSWLLTPLLCLSVGFLAATVFLDAIEQERRR